MPVDLLKIFGFPFPLGNPTIVIVVLFLGGIQLVSIGILGEYIGRIYEEVKGRPRFILDNSYGFDVPEKTIPEQRPWVAINEEEVPSASKRKEPVLRPRVITTCLLERLVIQDAMLFRGYSV